VLRNVSLSASISAQRYSSSNHFLKLEKATMKVATGPNLYGLCRHRHRNRFFGQLMAGAHGYAPTLGKFKGWSSSSSIGGLVVVPSRRLLSTSETPHRGNWPEPQLIGFSGLILSSLFGFGTIYFAIHDFYFGFKGEMDAKSEKFQGEISTKLDSFKTDIDTKLDGFKTEFKTDMDTKLDGFKTEFKTDMDTKLDGFKTELKTDIDTKLDGFKTEFKTHIDTKFDDSKADAINGAKIDGRDLKIGGNDSQDRKIDVALFVVGLSGNSGITK
jgi:hypothetical protein